RLFGGEPEYYEPRHRQTHSIATAAARLRSTLGGESAEVAARVWDFGGQPNLHGSHRFFMTEQRCLYLLVLDATRSACDNRLLTWLRSIRHRAGGQAPVLAVLTKCDEAAAYADALEREARAAAGAFGVNLLDVHRLGWRPDPGRA